MSPARFGRLARTLVLLQLGALPVAADLRAQAPLGGSAEEFMNDGVFGPGCLWSPCFHSAQGPTLTPILAGGGIADTPFGASAYARRGVIGAFASLDTHLSAVAKASWSDIISWSNPLVSSIVFSFAVNGQVVQPAPIVTIDYSFSYGSPPQRRQGGYSVFMGSPPDPFTSVLWQVNAPVAGMSSLPFQYAVGAYATYQWQWDLGITTATADAWQGSGLTGLTFLDAAGHAIDGVSYDFAAGTEFLGRQAPPPLSFAPEPGTIGLVGSGLLGLLGWARRRRRSAHDAGGASRS